MFASGIFIDSFSPKTDEENRSIVNAIKAFKTNIVIVLDNKHLEMNLRRELSEDKQFMQDNNTQIVFLAKPQGAVQNIADPLPLY